MMLCLYFHSVKRYTVHMNTKPCKKMSHRPIIRAPVTKHCYASIHRHEIGSNRSQQRGISIIYIDMLYIYLSTPKWSRDMGRNNYLLSSSDVDIDVFNNQVKFRPVSCAVIIEPYSPGMWPITAGLLIRNMQWCLRQAHHITV